MERFVALCLGLTLSLAAARPDRLEDRPEDRGDQYRAGKKTLKILRSRSQRAVFYKHQKGPGLFSVDSIPTGKSLSPQAWETLLHSDTAIAFTRDVLYDSASQAEFIPSDRLFAKVRGPLTADGARLLAEKAGVVFVAFKTENILRFKMTDPGADPLRAADRLSALPEVEWAQPEIFFKPRKHFLSDDPLFGRQQHLHNVGQNGGTPGADVKIAQAWDITRGDSSIVIAILDDGVQTAHPDLRIRSGGKNFFIDPPTDDPNPTTAKDDHGTSVAGVAAARGNNGVGVSGAAPNAAILPIKISENESFSSNVGISDAIRYAADAGADIINNSWGGGPFDNLLNEAITYASTRGRSGKGCLVFCSSGNSSGMFNGTASKRGGPLAVSFSDTSTPPGDYSIGFRFSDASSVPGDTDWVAIDNISVLASDGYTVRFSESFAGGLPSGWTSSGTPWVADSHYYSGTGDHVSMRSGVVRVAGAWSELRMPLRTYAVGDLLRINWILNNAKGDFQIVFYNAAGINMGATSSAKPDYSFGKFSGNADIAFPASADSAIAVGSSTEFDFRSGYSQFNEAGTGKSVDFLSPSNGAFSGVTTTDRTGTDGSTDSNYTSAFGGTSSASPLAAGVAALILSRNPQLTRVQVLAIMRATADKIGDRAYVGGRNTEYGYGRLNAYQALLAVPLPPSATTAVSPSDAAVQSSGNAMFKWSFVAGAPDYRLQLSLNPTFDALAFDDATLSDTARLVNQLAAGVKYYWRVSAVNTGGISPWTATRSFTTPDRGGPGPQWSPTAFSPGTSVKALGLLGTHVYAGTAAGLYQTGDNGTAWVLANGNLGGMIVQTMISNRDSLLIGTDAGGVGRSTDSARNFAKIGYNATGITNYNILALAKRGAILLAGTGGGVFRSVDNGASWNPAGHFTDSIFAMATLGTDFFLGTSMGAYRSSDNGVSWTPLGGGLGGQAVCALGVNGGNLFAGTRRGKVFRSPDNGATWHLTNEGWGGTAIGSFAAKGKALFAGTVGGGVYFSPDTGESWLHINRGLTDTLVGALIANGAQVLAGTDHGGIFKYLGLPPKVTAGIDRNVDEGQALAFAVTAFDPDGDAVSISLLNPPVGSVFNSVTGNFSWTPGFTQAGNYALYFRGASGTPVAADTDTVLVTVANVDRPPVVAGGADRIVDEGQAITFPVSGSDPDGDAVTLTLLNPPPGAALTAGSFSWTPGFTQSGTYALVFQAGANGLIAKDTVVLTVNDVDRPPRLALIAAQSVREGDTLAFILSATDPDGDSVTYAMSGAPPGASLKNPSLTGPTLTGANFRWNPGYADSGHYQISFLARSRLLADTVKVGITVIEVGNGLGTLRLSGVPPGAIFGAMPSGSYPGGTLGKDSAVFAAKPGVYWFSAFKPGYRTSYVPGTLLLHQTASLRFSLKPAIPLWFAAPETLRVDGAAWVDTSGTALASADLDGDGKQDLLLAGNGQIQFLRNLGASDSVFGPYTVTAKFPSGATASIPTTPRSAAFVDWNNSGAFALLLADAAGSVFVVGRNGSAFTDTVPLKSFPGDSLRAWTLDWDGDGEKDLYIHFQGKGLFVYRNVGTDAAPAFSASAAEIFQTDGNSLVSLASAPVWLDADNDGEKDMLAFQNDTLKIWFGKRSGGVLKLAPPQPLDVGGTAFRCGPCLVALHIGALGLPSLIVAPKDGAGLVIRSSLRGDLNGDHVVDALDLGLFLDVWKRKRSDADWVPRYNLKLTPGGGETLDEGDLGLLENDWELRE